MCCQVTNPPVGCFVLLEVNVIVDDIKRFFYCIFIVAELYKLIIFSTLLFNIYKICTRTHENVLVLIFVLGF